MNKYKNALDNIKADASLKCGIINNIKKCSENGYPKKTKKLTVISAVAASLVIIIACSVFYIPQKGKRDNSFTLTAYAADSTSDEVNSKNLNNKTYIYAGMIKDMGATTTFLSGKVDKNNNLIEEYPENGDTIVEANHSFVFNLNCKGKNIDTVTFDSGNGKFKLSTFCDNVINHKGKSDNYNGFSGSDEYYCDSYVTKYNNQIWNVEPVFTGDKKGNQSGTPVYPKVCLETKFKKFEKYKNKPKPVKDFYDYYGDGTPKNTLTKQEEKTIYESYMNYFIKDLTVTVTAKFKDGSEESKKVKFKSEYLTNDTNGAKIALKAKIV